jgi:hypothetical protein
MIESCANARSLTKSGCRREWDLEQFLQRRLGAVAGEEHCLTSFTTLTMGAPNIALDSWVTSQPDISNEVQIRANIHTQLR